MSVKTDYNFIGVKKSLPSDNNLGIEYGGTGGIQKRVTDIQRMADTNNIEQYISNRLKTNFRDVINLKRSNVDDAEESITSNFIPKPWDSPYHYERQIDTQDLVFADSIHDVTAENHYNFTERTIISYQQVNHQIYNATRRATIDLYAAARRSGVHPKNGTVIDFDSDYLLSIWRTGKSSYFDDLLYQSVSGKAEQIMKKLVSEFENKLEQVKSSTNNVFGQQMQNEIVNQMADAYEKSNVKLFHEVYVEWHSYMYALSPELICNRWKFLGICNDSLQGKELRHEVRGSRQPIITVVSRGVELAKNIYGNQTTIDVTGNIQNNKNFMGQNINQDMEFHFGMMYDSKKYTDDGVTFSPCWMVPLFSINKESMLHDMDRRNMVQLHKTRTGKTAMLTTPSWSHVLSTTEYTKQKVDGRFRFIPKIKKKLLINSGYVTTQFVGRVLKVIKKDNVSSKDFMTMCGIQNYGKKPNGLIDSYTLRKRQRHIKLSIKIT